MDNYISAQIELYEQIKRAHSNFKKSPRDRLTTIYIDTKVDLLNQTWSSFHENHLKLLRSFDKKLLNATDYVTKEIYFNAEEEYCNAKIIMKERLKEVQLPVLTASVESHYESVTPHYEVRGSDVRIPVMKIPVFNGQYTEWISFHDQFVSLIHNNQTLSEIQKLHYLKMHVSGEAANLLRNIPVAEKNYEHAWNKLNKRFSNSRVIANAYLQRLMSIKPIHNESANSIKFLMDTTMDCLSGLNSIGVNTDNWDAIIIYLTTSKLDTESLRQWEDTINKDIDNTLPTLERLTEFLEARFRSLEGIQSTRTNTVRRQYTRQQPEKRVFYTNDTREKKEKCTYCDGDHYIYKCNQFTALNYEDKKKFIEKRQLCYNCLIPNHGVRACKHRTRCHKCGKRHHSLIHPPEINNDSGTTTTRREKTSERETQSTTNSEENITTCFTMKERVNTQILLATALVKAKAHNGKILQLRALIDQGSQGSFITESAAQTLGLRKTTINGSISGLGDTQTLKSKHMVTFILQSNTESSFSLDVDAYVLKTLTRLLPSKQVHVTWIHTRGLQLADPTYGTPGKVDLLLGAAVYSQILQEGIFNGPPGTPLAQKTSLGWILSGEVQTHKERDRNIINMHITTTEEDNSLLRKFWEIESDEICNLRYRMTEEETLCENIFNTSHSRDSEGRYIVTLPLRDNTFDYGNTRETAKRRLELLEKKLNKDESLKNEYTKVLMEYKVLKHMEEIEIESTPKTNSTFYLPHHPVIRSDKTTSKIRIVFDASCKGSNGRSLNENMLVGPRLQRELRHIIMTWRIHEIAFVADCIKMYRQIKVNNPCANLQRILWKENGHIKEYKLTRVTFGTASAPYLATKTLQQLANDESLKYPIASVIAKNDFYMDDLLTGGDSIEEACTIYQQMTDLLHEGGFEMQKWASNNKEFVKYVEMNGANTDETYVIKNDDVVKTLGIRWDRITDEFQYTVNLDDSTTGPITKRTILRDISKLFDPMGWLAPVIVIAKVLIQKLWLSGVEWDQEIPKTICEEWVNYKNNLIQFKNITVRRWLYTNKNDKRKELHGYSDASTKAYAAVVYLRVMKTDGRIHVQMITAKTKVAPTKTISVPRLELCGALLLTKLLVEVSEQLNITKENIHAYTDSSVVLAWLQSHPSRWKTYVANRTSEILTHLPSQHWHHITSGKNPADIASRGALPSQLLEHNLWWTGPPELHKECLEFGKIQENVTILEQKTIKVMTTTFSEDFDLFKKYSNLNKLLRVISYTLRFITTIKPKNIELTGEEIIKARMKCVLLCQRQEFASEIDSLKENKNIKKNSKLKTLNPFLDKNGVLRVGGRLANANLPHETKHQIILPGDHPFTKLILTDCHEKTLHGGPMLMLSYLRNTFWIIHAKSLVRQVVRNCIICTRFRASTAKQMMGSLPEVRVKPSRPFSHSGVDLAGPIDLRLSKGRGCKTQKGYIVIFICMVTRAIHIEIVTSLSAQDFIAAFKRFVARRGHCSDMWSDNATNLAAGNKELMSLFERNLVTVRAEIENLLANDGTTWHHIPASAPHFGGLWEAGVKSIKYHLKRILKSSTLTYEEMSTLTTQIESCLNSRPISPIGDDPSDITPLTPGHFLIGEAPRSVPEENHLTKNIKHLNRWQLTQRLYQDFWARWSREFLTRLQQRQKWSNQRANIAVGELVLIKEDNMPPGKWLMARVLETHPGKDNLTRVVSLKTKNSIIKRPIIKVCRLPIETDILKH